VTLFLSGVFLACFTKLREAYIGISGSLLIVISSTLTMQLHLVSCHENVLTCFYRDLRNQFASISSIEISFTTYLHVKMTSVSTCFVKYFNV